MKRDISITFAELDRIISQLAKYAAAQRTFGRVVEEHQEANLAQRGDAFEALETARQELERYHDDVLEEVEGLHDLYKGYTDDMGRFIHPIDRNRPTRVDRDDIWMNFCQIEDTVKGLHADGLWGFTYWLPPEPTPEQVAEYYRQRRNETKLHQMSGSMIPATRQGLQGEMEELWEIFDKHVVPFEQTDDEYARKARAFYEAHSSFLERLFTGAGDMAEGVGNFLEGIGQGALDTVKGIGGLAYGLGEVAAAGAAYGVSGLTGGDAPQWAKKAVDNFSQTAQTLINDPALLVEGIGQGFSDAYDTKGLTYVLGNGAFEAATAVVPGVGLVKIGKVGTVGNALKVAGGVERLADAGNGARVLDGVDKALDAARHARGVVRRSSDGALGKVKGAWSKTRRPQDIDVIDKYGSSIRQRYGQTPVNGGQWTGKRGESMWVPTKPAQVEVLKKYGAKGVKYKEGFPDFSPFAEPHKKYVHRLPEDKWKISDEKQFRDANLKLAEYLETHPEYVGRFSPQDLNLLKRGKKPVGYTWDHIHKPSGQMRLVSTELHNLGHYGGRHAWGGGTEKR